MFIDYYSILGVSFPSNDEEINVAYIAKKETLGADSENSDNSNYPMRVNIELAYRILGASYVLKSAYDKEYQNAIAEGFDVYEIKNDWLLSNIERERNYVVNKMVYPNVMELSSIPQKQEETKGMKVLGCIVRLLILLAAFNVTNTIIKNCQREKARNTLLSTTGKYIGEEELNNITNEIISETAEHELNYFVMAKNIRLPEKMNDSITCQAIQLEDDALVYVYDIDDAYFSEIKDNILSKDIQLQKLKFLDDDLQSIDEEMGSIIDLLVAAHRGICWRNVCRVSGEVFECKIDYDDLVNIK